MLDDGRQALLPDSATAQFLARIADAQPATLAGEPPLQGTAAGLLSGRERHILTLLTQGESNKEIARALGLAPDTVKYHLKSVFSKLSVGNRAQAAVQARSFGLA